MANQLNHAVEKVKGQVLAGANSAPAKLISLPELIQKSVKELGKALPAHMNADRLSRIALTVLKTTPSLTQLDEPTTFLAAIFQCAQLGLEPIAGQAYILPYNVRGRRVAQLQVGYQGWIELFWRHQSSLDIRAESVCEKDTFEYDLGANTLSHRPPAFGQDRGEVLGYYAIAHLRGGGMSFKVMSRSEVVEFAKRFTKCYDREKGEFLPGTPWVDPHSTHEMGKKTVLKQLLKTLPKSVEIQRALAMDETVKTKVAQDMLEVPNEAEFTLEDPAKLEERAENGSGAKVESPFRS